MRESHKAYQLYMIFVREIVEGCRALFGCGRTLPD